MSKDYYNYEESLGRRRKNRLLIESSPNVVDFEPYIISRLYLKGDERMVQRTYSWYLRHGYDFAPDTRKRHT